MSYTDEWEGTKHELHEIIDENIENIRMELGLDFNDKEMRQLFLEAFSRNLVQTELKDMIGFILESQ